MLKAGVYKILSPPHPLGGKEIKDPREVKRRKKVRKKGRKRGRKRGKKGRGNNKRKEWVGKDGEEGKVGREVNKVGKEICREERS